MKVDYYASIIWMNGPPPFAHIQDTVGVLI
jgi:hypothetical protein